YVVAALGGWGSVVLVFVGVDFFPGDGANEDALFAAVVKLEDGGLLEGGYELLVGEAFKLVGGDVDLHVVPAAAFTGAVAGADGYVGAGDGAGVLEDVVADGVLDHVPGDADVGVVVAVELLEDLARFALVDGGLLVGAGFELEEVAGFPDDGDGAAGLDVGVFVDVLAEGLLHGVLSAPSGARCGGGVVLEQWFWLAGLAEGGGALVVLE